MQTASQARWYREPFGPSLSNNARAGFFYFGFRTTRMRYDTVYYASRFIH
jgi:hypothetical protein